MFKKTLFCMVILCCFAAASNAADLAPIKLPAPDMKGGKPLMQCLSDRKTDRSFSTKKLPVQVLSNLLWAAAGINRPDSGKRTMPSAKNWQEMDVYVAMEEGLYRYDAKSHILEPALKSDLRKATTNFLQPTRSVIAAAPLQLIYVADHDKMTIGTSDENRLLYSGADAAFISQNVYLYCASEGLVTGVRALVDRAALAKDMKLRDSQKVVWVQAVGYPKEVKSE